MAVRDVLARGRRIALIGGGFIGLEFAAVARGLGVDVTVIEAADRLMTRVVSPDTSHVFFELHRASGVSVLLDTAAAAVIARTRATAGVQLGWPRDRRRRRAQGLTQEQLEERSGFSQQYLSGLERGRRNPTVVTVYELAQAMGVGHLELLRPDEESGPTA